MRTLHFELQNWFLEVQNHHLGAKNRNFGPPKSILSCLGPPSSNFYRSFLDFQKILVASGLKIYYFFLRKPLLRGSLRMHCQAQRILIKYAQNLWKTVVFAMTCSCSSSHSVQHYPTCCIILSKKTCFFCDVPWERLPTLIWKCFGLHFGRFGPPSWSQVGASWTSNCDFRYLFDALGLVAEACTEFELCQEQILAPRRPKIVAPGKPPAPCGRPPAVHLEGLGKLQP